MVARRPLQGGGGPTRPGTYQFATHPPVCAATFTVPARRPATRQAPRRRRGTLPFTGSHTPLLLAIGSGLLAAGIGLVLLVRRPARPTA
jgi:LPXTG-motif cell wall-anchored protein